MAMKHWQHTYWTKAQISISEYFACRVLLSNDIIGTKPVLLIFLCYQPYQHHDASNATIAVQNIHLPFLTRRQDDR